MAKFEAGKSQFNVWDLSGNVGEWVNDWYEENYFSSSPNDDPKGPSEGQQKVHRGGGYHTNKVDIRVSARHFALVTSYHEYVGFRCGMDGNE